MAYDYDATGVNVDGDFLVPDGEYVLTIKGTKEGKSKEGSHYQVTVNYQVAEGEHKGTPINFHRITFKPKEDKSAWMAISYLKAIGQPYQGQFTVDPKEWEGKSVLAWLEQREWQGKTSMNVKWVKPVEGVIPSRQINEDVESIPF
jgi:hypothetical protein